MLFSRPSLLSSCLLVAVACLCVATPVFAAGETCDMTCDDDAGFGLDVSMLGGDVGARFSVMEARLAAMSTLAPNINNCTDPAQCPCYPVNPCSQGEFCVAYGSGVSDYNCGQPYFPSSYSAGTGMATVVRDVQTLVHSNYGSNNYRLGRAVAFNYDGSVLAAARYRRDAGSTAGAVEMFERINDTYSRTRTFYGSGVTGSELGHNLQFSQDGTTLVAGSLYDGSEDATGAVFVYYSATGKDHSLQSALINPIKGTHFGWFKNTIALSSDANMMVVGCPNCHAPGYNTTTGALLVYSRSPNGGTHFHSQTILPRDDVVQQDSQLGFTVSMDSAGSTLVYAVRNPADPLQKLGVMVRATTSSDFAFAYSVDPAADPRNLRMLPSGMHFFLADFDGNLQVYQRNSTLGLYYKRQTIGFGADINFGVEGATSATGATIFGANLANIHSPTSGTAFVITADSQGNFFAQGQYSPVAVLETGSYSVSSTANGAYAVGISGNGMMVGTGSAGVYGPSGWAHGKVNVYAST